LRGKKNKVSKESEADFLTQPKKIKGRKKAIFER
jgi:hypothetical protein